LTHRPNIGHIYVCVYETVVLYAVTLISTHAVKRKRSLLLLTKWRVLLCHLCPDAIF